MEEDYGYIGEPDLGTFDIGSVARSLSREETPLRRAQRLAGHYAVDFDKTRQIVLTSMKMAEVFESLAEKVGPEAAMTWTLGPISSSWAALEPKLNDQVIRDLMDAVEKVVSREITDSEGRRRIAAIAAGECPQDISCAVQDSQLDSIISTFLEEHPQVIKDYASNPKSANSVIGHVMKAAPGKYNSREVVEAVRKEIEKRKS